MSPWVRGAGAVKKFDGVSGRFLDNFTAVAAGPPGYLARASSLAWYEGDLLAVSCDPSKGGKSRGARLGTRTSRNPQCPPL